jgi:hypothetical protein
MDGVHNLPPELTGCRETRGAIVNEFDQNGRKAHRAAPGCAPRTGFVRDMLDMWRNVSGRCLAVSPSRRLAVSRSRYTAARFRLQSTESGIGNRESKPIRRIDGWIVGWIALLGTIISLRKMTPAVCFLPHSCMMMIHSIGTATPVTTVTTVATVVTRARWSQTRQKHRTRAGAGNLGGADGPGGPGGLARDETGPSFPQGTAEIVKQCYQATKKAYMAGVRRQRIELILPLIGATDIDDWPGGIRQQFKAAQPMVQDVLVQLKALPELQGPLDARIVDDADAVGAWQGENLSLVLFPTAETIGALRKIRDATKELVIIANPQWNEGKGNVVSDFGILPWQRASAMEVASSFEDVYVVKQLRINGDNTRWLYYFGFGWQIFVVRGPRELSLIMTSEAKPTYADVEKQLRSLDWTMSSKGLFDRIAAEAEFNRQSLEAIPPNEE